MGLIAWYKLDGNYEDASLNGRNLSTSGSISFVNGKINQCCSLNGLNSYLSSSYTPLSNDMDFTMSCWIKATSAQLVNAGIISFGYYPIVTMRTDGKIDAWWYNGVSYPHLISTNSCQDSNWHSIIFTRTGGTFRLYIDGVLNNSIDGSSTSIIHSSIFIGREFNSGDKIFNGLVDDVRIYDHCLTTQEVINLYKANIINFDFSLFQEPTTNLVTSYTTYWNNSGTATWNWNDTAILSIPYPNSPTYSMQKDTTGNSAIEFGRATTLPSSYYAFSVWFWQKRIGGGSAPYIRQYPANSNAFSLVWEGNNSNDWNTWPQEQWIKLTGAFLSASNATNANFCAYLNDAGDKIAFNGFQIENKSYSTEYTSSSREGKIIDCSGYNNHYSLVEATTPKWESDGSYFYYKFNGVSSFIDSMFGYNINPSTDIFSVSFWVRPTSLTNCMVISSSQIGDSNARFYIGIYNGNWDIGISTSAWGTGTTPIQLNQWQHVLIVMNGSQAILYINGVQSIQKSYSSYSLLRNIYIGIHDSNYWFSGDIRDFKINKNIVSSSDIAGYNTVAKLDEKGNFYFNNLIEYKHSPLILNYYTWLNGQTGSVGQFSQNGATAENYRILGTDPWGKPRVMWEARPEAVSDADGGWNSSAFPIDNTKLYRYSTWVWRNNTGNGSFYLGAYGYNSGGSNIGLISRSSGSVNTNLYFYHSSSGITPGRWELVVAHVWPVGSGAGANHVDSGRYTTSGKYASITTDAVWQDLTTQASHRSYLYYCTDINLRQRWIYPRVDICDGSEPSVEELLAGFDSNNFDFINSNGYNNYLSLDFQSTIRANQILLNSFSNYLIGFYPLNKNTLDHTMNNNNGVAVNNPVISIGVKDYCYTFNGSNTYITIPYSSVLSPTTSISVSVWAFNSNWSTTPVGAIVSKTETGGYGLRVNETAGYVGWSIYANGSYRTIFKPCSELSSGWHHFVGTFDGQYVKLYVDGIKYITEINLGAIYPITYSANNSLIIGAEASSSTTPSGQYYTGKIQDVRIYSIGLSQEQVSILNEMTSNLIPMKQSKNATYINGDLKILL